MQVIHGNLMKMPEGFKEYWKSVSAKGGRARTERKSLASSENLARARRIRLENIRLEKLKTD